MTFDGYKHADMPPDWEEERRGLPKAMDDAGCLGFCRECDANMPLEPATQTFGMRCGKCGSNRIEREKPVRLSE